MSPRDWGEMTLLEFSDAIEGFNELENERLKWHFYTARKIAWWAARPHLSKDNNLKESDIIPIADLDEEIEKSRLENLPLAEITFDGPV